MTTVHVCPRVATFGSNSHQRQTVPLISRPVVRPLILHWGCLLDVRPLLAMKSFAQRVGALASVDWMPMVPWPALMQYKYFSWFYDCEAYEAPREPPITSWWVERTVKTDGSRWVWTSQFVVTDAAVHLKLAVPVVVTAVQMTSAQVPFQFHSEFTQVLQQERAVLFCIDASFLFNRQQRKQLRIVRSWRILPPSGFRSPLPAPQMFEFQLVALVTILQYKF
jgi:hypothetical protein